MSHLVTDPGEHKPITEVERDTYWRHFQAHIDKAKGNDGKADEHYTAAGSYGHALEKSYGKDTFRKELSSRGMLKQGGSSYVYLAMLAYTDPAKYREVRSQRNRANQQFRLRQGSQVAELKDNASRDAKPVKSAAYEVIARSADKLEKESNSYKQGSPGEKTGVSSKQNKIVYAVWLLYKVASEETIDAFIDLIKTRHNVEKE